MERVFWTCPSCQRECSCKASKDDVTEVKCNHCQYTTEVKRFYRSDTLKMNA